MIVLLASTAVPQVFQTFAGWAVKAEAWRRGGRIQIERIEGSLWEPVIFVHTYAHFEMPTGAVTRVEVARAEAQFSWQSLFHRNGERWFQRLSLRGVEGKVSIPLDEAVPVETKASRPWLPLPQSSTSLLPAAIDAQEIDFVFQSGTDYVRVEDASFAASTTQAGEMSVPRLTINQPWLRRTFRNVRGKTAIQDERFAFADVELEKGVKIRGMTISASPLARGELDIEANIAAFDGTLSVDAATRPTDRGVVFESAGNFGQINIAKLASFLALSDAAGGVIKDGKFTFRGPPRDLAKAQASLRFDAVNFQWETRQWDSLTLGLVLMDRRVQVPQLDLRQGKNELHLSGELALPGPDQQWWQGDFNTTVNAKIENLTDLSALLLPEFKYAAGRATIEGSIRGRGEEFNGQLLVSGERITWRNAPIETLHAAVKLNGKEVQVANVELVNGDDLLRGRGLVKFSNPPVYWGEFRVAVEDLKTYAAFLQKPVLPEPLAGGAIIDWTGEGSSSGHSGKFQARLRRVRSLGALAQQLHPINADLAATYGADTMQFSRFSLSDEDSVFTANVAVGGNALHLQDLQFVCRGVTQLEGSALLPLDVWQKWPDVAFAQLLTPDVVSRVQLMARQLDLAAASRLTGWKFPLAGLVDGTFSADGPIKALKLGGNLKLVQGRIPLNWNADLIDQATAQFSFRDNAVVLDQFVGKHRLGDLQLGGEIQLTDLANPTLQLTLRTKESTVPLFGTASTKATVALDLAIAGPFGSPTVKGTASPTSLTLGPAGDLRSLWGETPLQLAPIFTFTSAPWSAWKFEIACRNEAPLKIADRPGTFSADFQLAGAGAAPSLVGKVEFAGVQIDRLGSLEIHPWLEAVASAKLLVDSATLEFSPTRPSDPSLNLDASGQMDGEVFSVSLTGPLSHLLRTYNGPPPLTDAAVRNLLMGKTIPAASSLDQEVRVVLEVQPPIVDPAAIYPPATVMPAPATTPLEPAPQQN